MKGIRKTLAILLCMAVLFTALPMFNSLTLTASAVASSGTFGNNFTWNYNSSTKTLIISGTGRMPDFTKPSSGSWEEILDRPWKAYYDSIQNVVISDGITYIGKCAFYYPFNESPIISAVIPESVTEIAYSAFANCSSMVVYGTTGSCAEIMANASGLTFICGGICGDNLTWSLNTSTGVLSVTGTGEMYDYSTKRVPISQGVTAFVTSAPWGDYRSYIKTVVINDGVKSVGEHAFQYCVNIKKIIISNSVTNIGISAFSACKSLTDVSIPTGVISISDNTFSWCSSLESISIPSNITSICVGAFEGSGLTNITIPNGVKKIGEEAFYGCSSLKSISLSQSVTDIEKGAFSYSSDSLESIRVDSKNTKYFVKDNCLIERPSKTILLGCNSSIIPKDGSVTSIGYAAFSDCKLLTNISIPNNITSIGDAAFCSCTSITDITIPNSVKRIGVSAFSNCTSLTSIVLPDSVTEIGGAAFRSCRSLTNITIPNSVTSVGNSSLFDMCVSLKNVTLSNKIPRITRHMFFYCKSLTHITIPNGVTSIGEYAFYRCTGLKSITIPDSVTSIDDYAFYGCPYLSIKCYPNSYAETYARNNNISYSYIKSVSPSIMQAAPTPINQTGAVFVDYKTGKYIIDDLSASFSTNHLFASKSGYYSVDISPYPYAGTSVSGKKLTLVPESTKSGICAVYCNNTDVLSNSVSIEDNSSNTVNIKVYPASGFNIGKFQLMHKTTPIAESYDGSFSINASTLQASGEYYVRLVNSAGRLYNKIKIGLSITKAVDIDIDLGDIACFTIPDSVPIIGGEDIKISLSDMPFGVVTKGDSTFVTIGTGFDYVSEEYSASGIMKQLEDAGKDFSKAKKLLKQSGKSKKFKTFGGSLSVDLNVALCAELKRDFNGLRLVAGKALISLEGSGSKEFQTYALVPIVIKTKLAVGASMQATLGLDSRNALYLNTNAEFTLPQITLSAGVGLTKVADISVYGSASNNINIDFAKQITTASLKGEIGLSAKVFFASTKLKFFSGTWEYYNSASVAKRSNVISPMLSIGELNEKALDTNNYIIDRSHLETQSEWQSTPQKRMLMSKALRDANDNYSATEIKELQTDVYNNANPKTVSLNSGKQIMVWTADIAERDDSNCTAAVYSVYDPVLEFWSEPAIIDDDGTADSYVDIATDGETVYAVWCDENIVFENTPAIDDLASHSEIKYAVFNSEKDIFGDAICLTDDEFYDTKPKAFVNNGTAYITWVKNSGNSPIELSGSNTLFSAIISDDTQINELAEENVPITEYNIGILNDNLTIFYCKDTDGSIITSDDVQLLLGGLNDEFSTYELPSNVGNVQFLKLNGIDTLMYYKNNSVYGINAVEDIEKLLIENIDTYDFTAVSSDDSCAIICSKNTDSESEDGSVLYAYMYNDGCFSAPVQITDNSGYVVNANGYIDNNGELRVVFVRKDVEFNEDNFIEHSAICDAKIVPNYDLYLVSIDYSDEGIEIGDNMPITYTIKNCGLFDIESYTVSIIDSEDNTIFERTIDEQILIGQEKIESVEFEFPNISKLTNYTFKISPNNVYDGLSYNNTCDLFIGHSSISAKVEKTLSGCGDAMQISVQNNGRTDENLMLYIYDGDNYGKVLDVCDLGLILKGETLVYEYVAQYMRQLNNEESVIYAEVKCGNSENYISDNGSYVPYKTLMLELLDGKEVEYYFDVNNDGEFNIIDLIVLKKMMVSADENQQDEEADLNGDLQLNSLDAIVMIKKLLL